MQTSTQALIQRYYDYFNQRNLSAFLSLLDPEVVHDINQGETQIGIDAFTAFMGRMNDAYEEQITDLVIMTTADGTRAAAEFVDKRAAATSNGFAGTLGYFGAAVAGYPVGKMIEMWGWHGFFTAMLLSSAVIFMMLLPLWSTNSGMKRPQVKMGWSSKRTLEKA